MSENTKATAPDITLGYDRTPANIPKILLWTVLTLATLAVVMFAVTYYYQAYFDQAEEAIQLAPPSKSYQEIFSNEEKQLGMYGVADKAAGTYRIPVAKAMELLVSESASNQLKYPTAAYAVKEDAAAGTAPAAGSAPAAGAAAPPAAAAPAPAAAPAK